MKTWVPKQYGVWAMLLTPVLAGGILAHFSLWHALLILAWVSAYLGFMAVRGWLRTHRRDYVLPVIVYCTVGVICAAVLLAWRPGLVWWAPILGLLSGSSLILITHGQERSVANDALLIGASCLMTVVAATAFPLTSLRWSVFLDAIAHPQAWLAALIFAGYFWGTIFYVKIMIRERGKRGWYLLSVAYHAVLVLPAFLVNPWIGAIFCVILLRAGAVPRLWPRAKPKYIGIGEIIITVAMTLAVCLTL